MHLVTRWVSIAALVAVMGLVGCDGQLDSQINDKLNDQLNDQQDQPKDDSITGDKSNPINLTGAVVKGPLVDAVVAVYPLQMNAGGSAVTIGSTAIANGTTNSSAEIVGVTIPDSYTPPFIVEFSANSQTTDLMTGQPPLIQKMRTVVTADSLQAQSGIYGTALTTLIIDSALAITNNDSNNTPTISRFVANLGVAKDRVLSTVGFGLGDIDPFTTAPLVNSSTKTTEQLQKAAQYRAATEALSAIAVQLAEKVSESGTTVNADAILSAMGADLATPSGEIKLTQATGSSTLNKS